MQRLTLIVLFLTRMTKDTLESLLVRESDKGDNWSNILILLQFDLSVDFMLGLHHLFIVSVYQGIPPLLEEFDDL